MTHEELIKLSMDPKYEICKDYVTEALSYKLNRYESAIKDNLKLKNINFRVN